MQQYVVNVTTNSADKKATANKFKNWQAKNQNKDEQTLFYESERLKLYESYAYLMEKLFSNIITDKESIDKTQALNTLKNCDDKYCKLYKAYFLAATSKETKAKAIIDPLIANDKAKSESCYFMHHLYG